MQEALITEEVIKELRDLVDLQGTTRSMVQATLGTSGTQLERYHAIQKKLSQEFMQEFRNGNINISVARELTDLDEKHQDEALGLYRKNETITLPEVKALKEKQEVGRQVPGPLTLDEVIGRRRPPEDGTVIDVDIQIERFFESLKKSTTERIQKRDKNMSIYMLSIIYNDVRIRNGYLNYQGKSNGILFNPGSGDEKLITWQQLAETLIEKYGKKQKAVKLAPMPEPQKECPYYDANEVFLPDIARMINVFLENAYKGMGPGNTRRFRVMGTEFAAVQRQKEDDFVFYDEQGEKVCYVSRERMAAEYQKRMEPEEPVIEESDMSDSDKCERCENAAENKKTEDEKQQIIELIPEAWPPELKDIPVPSMIVMDDILQDAEENLKNYLSVADQGIPGRTILKYQLIAGGLRMIKNLVRDCLDDENIDDGKSVMEQLPLPVMRNNDQRKEWLRNYKDWGLWYTDEHIGVRYYKYDFANGARLIAEEYDRDTVHSQWVSDHTESYYMHLIGGPEPERKSGIPKWTQHGRYNKFPNSESELVEFLKEVQRESK